MATTIGPLRYSLLPEMVSSTAFTPRNALTKQDANLAILQYMEKSRPEQAIIYIPA